MNAPVFSDRVAKGLRSRRLSDLVLPDFSQDGFANMPVAIQRFAIERTCLSFLQRTVARDRDAQLSLPQVDQRERRGRFQIHGADGAPSAQAASSRIDIESPDEGAAR